MVGSVVWAFLGGRWGGGSVWCLSSTEDATGMACAAGDKYPQRTLRSHQFQLRNTENCSGSIHFPSRLASSSFAIRSIRLYLTHFGLSRLAILKLLTFTAHSISRSLSVFLSLYCRYMVYTHIFISTSIYLYLNR